MTYSIQIKEQKNNQALIEVYNVKQTMKNNITYFDSIKIGVLLIENEQITDIYQGNGFNLSGSYLKDYDIESVKNKKLHGVCKTFHGDNLYSITAYYDDKPLQIFKPNNNICNHCIGPQFKFINDLGLTVCMNNFSDVPQEILIERKFIEGGYVDKVKNYDHFPTIIYDNKKCKFYLEQITNEINEQS